MRALSPQEQTGRMLQNNRSLVALVVLAGVVAAGLFQLFAGGGKEPDPRDGTPRSVAPEAAPVDRIPDGPVVSAPGEPDVVTGSLAALSSAALNPGGDFDYYIVALSWSPTYCLEDADPQRDRRQCQSARPFAFVLHGLWPQHERGYPERCKTGQPRVPDEVIDKMMDVMPSRGLAGHQWRKHGACTGLSSADYFAASRAAFGAVKIPAEFSSVSQYVSTSPTKVEAAFLAANPGLNRDGVTVMCSRKHLREVRVCLTKDLKFRTCGADARRDCGLAQIVMPPARGGR
jgi:ribonuclease T2